MHVDLAASTAEYQSGPQGLNDYAELKRRIVALGLLNRQPGYYAAKFAVTGGLLAAGLLALVFSGNDPWLRLAEAAFLSRSGYWRTTCHTSRLWAPAAGMWWAASSWAIY